MKTLNHRYYLIKDVEQRYYAYREPVKDRIYFDTQDGTTTPLFPISAQGGWEALTDATPYNPTAIDHVNTLSALREEMSNFPQYEHILGGCIREIERYLYETP